MNVKPTAHSQCDGFSLLEIIMVLMLIGLVGVLTVPLLGTVLRGAVMGGVEQQTAEEAYWASARMTSVVGLAVDVDDSSPTEPKFGLSDVAADSTNWVSFIYEGDTIFYVENNAKTFFWGDVSSFNSSYADGLFQADIQLVDTAHPTISLDIHVRNAQ